MNIYLIYFSCFNVIVDIKLLLTHYTFIIINYFLWKFYFIKIYINILINILLFLNIYTNIINIKSIIYIYYIIGYYNNYKISLMAYYFKFNYYSTRNKKKYLI